MRSTKAAAVGAPGAIENFFILGDSPVEKECVTMIYVMIFIGAGWLVLGLRLALFSQPIEERLLGALLFGLGAVALAKGIKG